MKNKHESSELTYSNELSIKSRKKIFKLMQDYDARSEEFERSLGLFVRGSLLARILAITDIYNMILQLPGTIFDIGCWRGQTSVVCENLRAIYEPLNFNRRIYLFDTFTGYKGFKSNEKTTEYQKNNTYSVGDNYPELLNELLILHEKSNAMGHNNGKHQIIKGDCRKTLPKFFKDYPNELIALSYFDLNAFEPTKIAIDLVWDKTVSNGILAFWQLTRNNIHGESIAYQQSILNRYTHDIHICPTYPGLTYIIKK